MVVTSPGMEILAQPGEKAHLVQFCENASVLGAAASLFLHEGLVDGEAAVVIATPEHREAIRRGLEERGLDQGVLQQTGRIVVKDARRTLDAFLRDGVPDAARFMETAGPLFAGLQARGYPGVRVVGDLVSLLWQDGRFESATRLEELWNDLGRRYDFTLLCAHEGNALAAEYHGRPSQGLYAAHTCLVPPPNYERLTDAVDRAMDEVLGEERSAALRSIIRATRRRVSVTPGAQESLLWLQAHLPGQVDAVLAAARRIVARRGLR